MDICGRPRKYIFLYFINVCIEGLVDPCQQYQVCYIDFNEEGICMRHSLYLVHGLYHLEGVNPPHKHYICNKFHIIVIWEPFQEGRISLGPFSSVAPVISQNKFILIV